VIDRYVADYLLPMVEHDAVHAPGFVDVAGTRVVAAGPVAEAPLLPAGSATHDVGGVLLPGLVNGHAHTPMTVLRGAGEGLPLERWLTEAIWPREARLTLDDVRAGMSLGAAELLLGGVTTSVEMYFFSEAVVEGAVAAGLRTVVTPAVVDGPDLERFGTPEQQMAGALALRDATSAEDLVEVGIGPHSAYTLGDETLAEVGRVAADEGLLLHIHVAETRTEGDAVTERTGRTVPEHLGALGVLDGRVSIAHGVWLSDSDIGLLAEHGVGVAHCPGSNGKLASGIAPVASLRGAGVPVGAGTDGPASNNDLDLWEEARLALLYARLREDDAAALGVWAALRMVTSEAATAIGRPDLGSLQPGARADMIRVSLDHVAYTPITAPADVASHLVWAGSARDVTDVWVGGRRVVAAREVQTFDVTAVRAAVEAAARRISS
jgi:5-methylthioadenosine/S-adenosylhomocysteine deaminase